QSQGEKCMFNKEYQEHVTQAATIAQQMIASLPSDYSPLAVNAHPQGWNELLTAIDQEDHDERYCRLFEAIRTVLSAEHEHLLFEFDEIVGARMAQQETALMVFLGALGHRHTEEMGNSAA